MFSVPPARIIEREQRQMFWRRIFRRIFLEDWATKLIALIITFILWYGVTGLRTPTITRLKNVSLVTRVSNDMEITNTLPEEVDIVVTGDKRLIDRINTRDLVISIDLTDIRSGDRIVQLTRDTVNLQLPNGIKLEEIQPNKIAVKLERVNEKEVEVKVETEGNITEGFEIYNTKVLPTKVKIRGAESFVKSLDSISTEKINIEGLKENFFARQIGLNLVNPKITVLDTIVDVSFFIGEKRIERVFTIPLEIEGHQKNVIIILLGGRSVLDNLNPEELKVEIIKNENGEETAAVTLPENLQNIVEIRKTRISR